MKKLLGFLIVFFSASFLLAQRYDGNGNQYVTVAGTVTITGTVTANQGGTWNITNITGTISLPTGAATESTLSTRLADSTLTGRFPAGANPADNESNTSSQSRIGAYNFVFDGSTWDRWTGAVTISGTPTVTVGTFPDNEPFNLAQVAGAAPSATNPLSVRQTDGSAYIDPREIEGQNNVRPIFCTDFAPLNMTTATTTQIVAASGSTVIYVCSYAIHVGGASNVKVVRGTGTNCGTGTTDVSTTWKFTSAGEGINRSGGNGLVLKGAASGALCITSSAAVNVDVEVAYTQF